MENSLNHDAPDLHDDHDLKKSRKSVNPKNQGADNSINEIMAAIKNTKAFYNTEIPSDWEVKKLGDCCLVKGEYGINAPAVEFSNDLPAYLRITDIDDDGNYSTDKKASVGDPNYEQFILKNGDIVFARTGATVGKTYLYKPTDGILVFAGFLIRFRTIEEILTSQHLKYFTETKHYWDWVKTVSMRSGQPGINAEEYASLKIPLPPLHEQKAIAQVLSTADAVIHTTEKLIAQKELRKKWLMQQLLTGKKRLKGFDGEWKEKKLEYFIEEYKQKPTPEDNYLVLTSAKSGLMKQTDYYGDNRITNRDDADYNVIPPYHLTYRSRSDDGLFTFNKNDLGITGLISGYYPVFSIKNGDLDFILMYMNYYRQKLTKYAIGTSQLVLAMNALKAAKFVLPEHQEQTAIAQVLQAADKEISLLKAKSEKLREQKKGLMQQLLTGKKRLKINNNKTQKA
ncbi:MAG: restriction endonuclease subunit S [Chitinophagales bacterium]